MYLEYREGVNAEQEAQVYRRRRLCRARTMFELVSAGELSEREALREIDDKLSADAAPLAATALRAIWLLLKQEKREAEMNS